MSRDKISRKKANARTSSPSYPIENIFALARAWQPASGTNARKLRFQKRGVRCLMNCQNCAPGLWRQWGNIILNAENAKSIIWDGITGECARECWIRMKGEWTFGCFLSITSLNFPELNFFLLAAGLWEMRVMFVATFQRLCFSTNVMFNLEVA